MLLQTLDTPAIAIALRVLEGKASRVEEGREGGNKVREPLILKFIQQKSAVVYGVHYRLRGLLWEADHEENVHSPTARCQGRLDRFLQGLVGVVPAAGLSYFGVVGLRGDLQAEPRACFAHFFQQVLGGRAEELQDKLVLGVGAVENFEKAIGIILPRLADIPQDKDGTTGDAPDAFHIMSYRLRGAEGGTVSVIGVAEGGSGAAADHAVLGAAPAGKHRGEGIAQPSLEGEVASQVAVAGYRLYRVVVVVNHHLTELIRDVREVVFVQLPFFISPGKIGHRDRLLIICDALH